MNAKFVESLQFASGFAPVNMQLGANTAAWVNLKEYRRLAIVFFKSIGTAGDDPTITLNQATAIAGTSSKALTIPRVDKKQGTDLTVIGQFTTSTPASPATNDTFSTNTWTNSDLAEQQAIVVIEITARDLDIANGFNCVQASVGDIGTHTQLGGILYLLGDAKDEQDPLPSAIIN